MMDNQVSWQQRTKDNFNYTGVIWRNPTTSNKVTWQILICTYCPPNGWKHSTLVTSPCCCQLFASDLTDIWEWVYNLHIVNYKTWKLQPCLAFQVLIRKKKFHILSYYLYIFLDPSSHQKWAEMTELRTNELTTIYHLMLSQQSVDSPCWCALLTSDHFIFLEGRIKTWGVDGVWMGRTFAIHRPSAARA